MDGIPLTCPAIYDFTLIECDYCPRQVIVRTTDLDLAWESAVDAGWRVREFGQAINGKREFAYHQCPQCWFIEKVRAANR